MITDLHAFIFVESLKLVDVSRQPAKAGGGSSVGENIIAVVRTLPVQLTEALRSFPAVLSPPPPARRPTV